MKRIGVLAVALFLACGIAFFATQQQAVRAHESKEWVEFAQWLVKFQKEYANEWELMERFGIFRANKHAIEAHNAEKHNWTKGINQFTDLTVKEFEEIYLNGLIVEDFDEGQVDDGFAPDAPDAPDSIDWEDRGAVNPVRSQGGCGSCWAFAAAGAMEGAYYIKYQQSKIFSTQQLVDCTYTRSGCRGGWMMTAFKYWADKGIMSEDSYPYTARYGTCKYNSGDVVAKAGMRGYTCRNEAGLKSGAAKYVVSVAINAGNWGSYRGGIFNGDCSGSVNHGVTLTGYGTEGGQKFWRIKNSWGKWWGEGGYIKLRRTESTTSGGQCHVATYGQYVVAA